MSINYMQQTAARYGRSITCVFYIYCLCWTQIVVSADFFQPLAKLIKSIQFDFTVRRKKKSQRRSYLVLKINQIDWCRYLSHAFLYNVVPHTYQLVVVLNIYVCVTHKQLQSLLSSPFDLFISTIKLFYFRLLVC